MATAFGPTALSKRACAPCPSLRWPCASAAASHARLSPSRLAAPAQALEERRGVEIAQGWLRE
eukprot:209451-Pleurochrysis_carterae.AAC.1